MFTPTAERGPGRSNEIVWISPFRIDSRGGLPSIAAPRYTPHDSSRYVGQVEELLPAPTKIHVRSAVHGKVAFEGLEPEMTVGQLKAQIHQRLMLPPTRAVELSTWGSKLEDDWKTLQECRLKSGGQLDMRTTLAPHINQRHTLERVRVVCTALETRCIAVDKRTTGLELKQKIEAQLKCAEHSWYDKHGVRTAVMGVTLLAQTVQKGDPKTETPEIRLGEEFISTVPHLQEMGKGKPVSVIRARRGGMPFNIPDTNVIQLILPVEKQKLSFHGVEVSDTTTLWGLGCRTDDAVELEFESPVQPPILKILRGPEPEKKGKKGGGGKKKKGK